MRLTPYATQILRSDCAKENSQRVGIVARWLFSVYPAGFWSGCPNKFVLKMIAFHALQILGDGFGGEMKGQKPRVLFLSTGDATRSPVAEGFLRSLTSDRFEVASAGVEPGALNPLASEVMKEAGIDISGQQPQRIAQSLRERFGYVLAICDTARERSPIFPFTLNFRHWSIVDPNTAVCLPDRGTEVFRRVRDEIKNKVKQFIIDAAEIKTRELSIA